MKIIPTEFNGLVLLKPQIFKDERGYFLESFRKSWYKQYGIRTDFVQENESMSSAGVLRGMHLQTGEHAQAKLVKVITGKVYDVVVDLRANSPTYGHHYGVTLSGENKLQLYIPRGFAHGFLVMENNTIFSYKCDNYYNKESEAGIFYESDELNIDWPYLDGELIVSEKDKHLQSSLFKVDV